MTKELHTQLLALEGSRVSLALADGSRLDDCELVSAGRHRVGTLWLFTNGTDRFVALCDVVDVWEASFRGDRRVA